MIELGLLGAAEYQSMLGDEARGMLPAANFEAHGLTGAASQRVLRGIMLQHIQAMFAWDEGDFSFILDSNLDPWRGFKLESCRVVVLPGANPQMLALESARMHDEKNEGDSLASFLGHARSSAIRQPTDQVRRYAQRLNQSDPGKRAAAATPVDETSRRNADTGERIIPRTIPAPAFIAEPTATTRSGPLPRPTSPTVPMPPRPRVSTLGSVNADPKIAPSDRYLLIVDDDTELSRALTQQFSSEFAGVVVSNTVADAMDQLARHPGPWVIALDVIIARTDGGGVLGGIELLEMVRAGGHVVPVVLFSDYENSQAREHAARLGVDQILAKPRKSHVFVAGTISAAMRGFVDALRQGLLASATAAGLSGEPVSASDRPITLEPVPDTSAFDLRRELLGDLAEDEGEVDLPPLLPRASAELDSLRSMLAELSDPTNRENITLLVLRFAAGIVERAALFLATSEVYVGLGGFSAIAESEEFIAAVRKTHICVESESVLGRVSRFKSIIRGPLAECRGNRRLLEALGGGWHQHHTLAIPLVSGGRVAAILYGDNPSGKALGSTDSLEIFIQQAGMSMERTLLERKLEEARR